MTDAFHSDPLPRKGLRVIGDPHGCAEELRVALEGAWELGLVPAILGDLIDRGPDSPGCMALAMEAAGRGALVVPGNHCWKFARRAAGSQVRVGSSLAGTLDQLAARSDGAELSARFAAFVSALPCWRIVGSWILVHGAFHPSMAGSPAFPVGDGKARRLQAPLFSRALYGQSEGETDDGHPRQILDWVDEIPAGATVAVGHSWFSDAPRRTLGRLGGAVWHLDTGAGKGGRLGWIDVPTEELGDGAALRREKHVSLGEKAGWRAADGTPLLTILVGPSGAGKTTWAKANAPDGAWISSDAVREELLGDARDQSRGGEIVRVVRIRAAERLSRGLPVVLDMTHLRARERKESLALLSKGAPARYVVIDRPLEEKLRDGGWRLGQAGPYGGGLVEDHDRRFTSGLPQILSGDGVEGVEVLDLRKTKVE